MAWTLLKTEPGEYSFADLAADGATLWTGITSPAALAHLRKLRKADPLLIYHSGAERAIVGTAAVAGAPAEDPDNPGLTPAGEPKFAVVRIRAGKPLPAPVTLAALKADPRLAGWALLRQSRLSVVPLPPDVEPIVLRLCKLA